MNYSMITQQRSAPSDEMFEANNHSAEIGGRSPVSQSPKVPDHAEAIRLAGVNKSYGSVQAARDIDVTIRPGEFVTLLGPSGSGKTTLLQLIAGFLQPDSGTVYLNGKDATKLEPHARELGLVFQHYALFPHMDVAENVAYGLRLRKKSKAEQKARVAECLQMVDLEGMADRRPDELSGGQRQRVALARALAFNPEIVLLDEALGALDRRLRHALQFKIKEIQRTVGSTFVHVTHDQEEAMAMSDQIILMQEGRVVQHGTPRDLYETPASEFAAMFMGETNRLVGKLAQTRGNEVDLQLSGVREVVTVAHPGPRIADSSAVVACIRPERVQLARPGDPAVLSGRLKKSTFMGDHQRHEVQIGDGLLILKEPPGGPVAPRPGDEVGLVLDRGSVHIYPAT